MGLFYVDLLDTVNAFQTKSGHPLQDSVDRANYMVTFIIHTLSAAIIMAKMFIGGSVMDCMTTSDPGISGWPYYVNNYCWVEGTLPLFNGTRLPEKREDWYGVQREYTLPYYQWMGVFLAVAGLFWRLPQFMWRAAAYNRLGVTYCVVIKQSMAALNDEKFQSSCEYLRSSADVFFDTLWDLRCFRDDKVNYFKEERPSWLSTLSPLHTINKTVSFAYFVFAKLLVLVVNVGELLLLYKFLGYKDYVKALFKMDLLWNMDLSNRNMNSKFFPMVTYCPINFTYVGSNTFYLAQCMLPMNMLSEAVVVFLVVYLSALLLVNVFSTVKFMAMRSMLTTHYVRDLMRLTNDPKTRADLTAEKADIARYVQKFLRRDGVFILRLIEANADKLTAAKIAQGLWTRYVEKRGPSVPMEVVKSVEEEEKQVEEEKEKEKAGEDEDEDEIQIAQEI